MKSAPEGFVAAVLMTIAVTALSLMMSIGAAVGRNVQRVATERAACESACERRGVELRSVEENLCVCSDMRATSADYGRMFVECP